MAQAWDGFFMHSYFENGNDLISLFKRRISLASESWKREPTVAEDSGSLMINQYFGSPDPI